MSDIIGTTAIEVVPDTDDFATQVIRELRGVASQMARIGEQLGERFADGFEGVGEDIADEVADGVRSGESAFDGIGADLGGSLVKGFAALGIGAALVDSITEGLNLDAANDRIEAQLGVTADRAREIGEQASATFADGWGENLGEIQTAYSQVLRRFPDITDAALDDVTEAALTVADVFDQDFNSVIQAAQQLFVNGLAPSAEAALDQVATALQRTRGDQDEVLESINEYASSYARLGLDGTNVISALTSEWSTNQFAIDKVGDAVKELGIRLTDNLGDEAVQDALGAIGIEADEVAAALREGGPAAAEMTERIIEEITSIRDPARRTQVAVALMGEPYNDLGNNAVPILRDVIAGTDDLASTTDIAAAAYDNASTKITSFFRTLRQKVVTFIGNQVIPAVEDLGVQLGDLFSAISAGDTDAIGDIARDIGASIGEALAEVDWVGIGTAAAPAVIGLVIGLADALTDPAVWYDAVIADGRWQKTLPLILGVMFAPTRVLGPIAKALRKIPLVGRLVAWAVEGLSKFGTRIVQFVRPVFAAFGRGFTSAIDDLGPGVVRRFARFLRGLPEAIRGIRATIGRRALELVERFGAVVARFGPRQAITAFTKMRTAIFRFFARAGRWLFDAGEFIIRGLFRGITKAWRPVSRWMRDRRSAITDRIGDTSRTLYRRGRELVAGFFRGVLDRFAGVRTWLRDTRTRVRTLVGDTGRTLYWRGRDLIWGFRNGISSAMTGIRDWLRRTLYNPIVRGVKALFGIRSPSTVFADMGRNMILGLIRGLVQSDPAAFVKKVFGGIGGAAFQALNFLIDQGGVALSVLSQLSGNLLARFFGATGGVAGFRGGGSLVALGRWLQSQGARVGEHPAFGGVSAVHVPGSYHYRGDAIDANYGPGGQSAVEMAFFDRIVPMIRAGLFGQFREILWRVANHFDHLHVGGSFGHGGRVAETGYALVHAGEEVLTAIQAMDLTSAARSLTTRIRAMNLAANGAAVGVARTIVVPVSIGGIEVDRYIIDTVEQRVRVVGGSVQRAFGSS